MKVAAIGFRVHSGWAAAVAVTGSRSNLQVVARCHITLVDQGLPGEKQPYHAARAMPLARAKTYLERCRERSTKRARAELRNVAATLEQAKCKIGACAVLMSSGRPLPSLAQTLTSHALIHTAEGEHFRRIIINTAEDMRLSVFELRERELYEV